MKLFEKILRNMNLLKEDASVPDINDAISNMHPAVITYLNNEGNLQATGERTIFPVAYGISTSGNPVVRAFEKEGDTTTSVPAWKLFIVPNIKTWKTKSEETFENEELVGLNKDGKDKQMVTLYNVSPLSDEARKWINKEPVIKSTPVEKGDVDNGGRMSAKEIVNNTINQAEPQNSIDNSKNSSLFNNKPEIQKIEAEPETEPVTRNELQPSIVEPNSERSNNDSERMYPGNDWIDKDEIEDAGEDDETNDITGAYNDMMTRWNTEPEE